MSATIGLPAPFLYLSLYGLQAPAKHVSEKTSASPGQLATTQALLHALADAQSHDMDAKHSKLVYLWPALQHFVFGGVLERLALPDEGSIRRHGLTLGAVFDLVELLCHAATLAPPDGRRLHLWRGMQEGAMHFELAGSSLDEDSWTLAVYLSWLGHVYGLEPHTGSNKEWIRCAPRDAFVNSLNLHRPYTVPRFLMDWDVDLRRLACPPSLSSTQ